MYSTPIGPSNAVVRVSPAFLWIAQLSTITISPFSSVGLPSGVRECTARCQNSTKVSVVEAPSIKLKNKIPSRDIIIFNVKLAPFIYFPISKVVFPFNPWQYVLLQLVTLTPHSSKNFSLRGFNPPTYVIYAWVYRILWSLKRSPGFLLTFLNVCWPLGSLCRTASEILCFGTVLSNVENSSNFSPSCLYVNVGLSLSSVSINSRSPSLKYAVLLRFGPGIWPFTSFCHKLDTVDLWSLNFSATRVYVPVELLQWSYWHPYPSFHQ